MRPARVAAAAALVGVATLAPAVARVSAEQATRPCKRGDLIGTWVLARMRAASGFKVDRNDRRYFEHQRFVFEALGGFRHLASIRPFTPAALAKLLAAPSAFRWSFDDDGRVTMEQAGGVTETVACDVVTRRVVDAYDNPMAMPGDVLLTSYDGDRPVVRRQLVPAAEPDR